MLTRKFIWYPHQKNPMFIFKLTHFIEPAALVGTLLSKAYVNERTPDKMILFDTTRSRIGRSCVTNLTKNIAESWTFDWIGLPILTFKKSLAEQLVLWKFVKSRFVESPFYQKFVPSNLCFYRKLVPSNLRFYQTFITSNLHFYQKFIPSN